MSVRKRFLPAKKNGQRTEVWEASVGSGKDRDRKQFPTKRAADAWERENAMRLASGSHPGEKGKTTVENFWTSIYQPKIAKRLERGEIGKRYVTDLSGRITNYLLPTVKVDPTTLIKGSRRVPFDKGLGGHRVQDVTTQVAQKFVNDLRDAGVRVKSTRLTVTIAHGMFEEARRSGYVHANPFRRLEVTSNPDEDQGPVVPPTPKFVRALLGRASKHRVLLIVLASLGVRISEALALRWRHLDTTNQLMLVRTRLDFANMEEGRTKSLAGRRDIPVPKATILALAKHRADSSFHTDDDLIFCTATGSHLRHSNLRDYMATLYAQVSADLPPLDRFYSCGFHPLRHYAISAWIAAGLSAKTVQTYAGHSSIQITMDRYGHMFSEKTKWDVIDSIGDDLKI